MGKGCQHIRKQNPKQTPRSEAWPLSRIFHLHLRMQSLASKCTQTSMKNSADAHKSVLWRMHGCETNQQLLAQPGLRSNKTPRGERALYTGQRFHAATKVLVVAQEQTSENLNSDLTQGSQSFRFSPFKLCKARASALRSCKDKVCKRSGIMANEINECQCLKSFKVNANFMLWNELAKFLNRHTKFECRGIKAPACASRSCFTADRKT